jgi:hypothetical protein
MFRRLLQFPSPYRPSLEAILAREAAYQRGFGVLPEIFHSTDHKRPHVDLYAFPKTGRAAASSFPPFQSDPPFAFRQAAM